VAQKGVTAVAADQFRSPNVRLLLGNDACVEHIDNGIRFVTGLLGTLLSSEIDMLLQFSAYQISWVSK